MSGFPTIVYIHTVAIMGATSTQIDAADADRKFLIVQNISNEAVDIKVGDTAVVNEGIRLFPNGGVFEMKPSNGNLSHAVVNGISVSGSKTVLVTKG